jgi:transcription antitermination factor NusG
MMSTANQHMPINQLSATEARWFAVNTRYKSEKFVLNSLEKKGIDAYLPLLSVSRRYSSKVKHYEVPLINCYVFARIIKDQYVKTIETENVIRILKQGKDLLAIPNEEIETLKIITGQVLDAHKIDSDQIIPGTEVMIVSGQLAGVKGKIINKADKKSFVVELINIGYQFRLNIDMSILVPINQWKKTV